MQRNFILAGVGGQGILTIARAISTAALRRGLTVKQAEVHGMSQRGGAVQSHLRLADQPLFSDLIPLGQADIVLAVEPLETLRYVQYLRADGVLIASTNPIVNIQDYPPVEQVLERVADFPHHVLLDADGLARKAGAARSANIVALGAASLFLTGGTPTTGGTPMLPEVADRRDLGTSRSDQSATLGKGGAPVRAGRVCLPAAALEDAVAEMFSSKGSDIVNVNRRAFRIGRSAAAAYRAGLSQGAPSRMVRRWIDATPVEQLAAG